MTERRRYYPAHLSKRSFKSIPELSSITPAAFRNTLAGCCCLPMRRDRALQSPSLGFALTGQPFELLPIARKQLGKIGLKMLIYSLYVAPGIHVYRDIPLVLLRAFCPTPFGPACGCSILLLRTSCPSCFAPAFGGYVLFQAKRSRQNGRPILPSLALA